MGAAALLLEVAGAVACLADVDEAADAKAEEYAAEAADAAADVASGSACVEGSTLADASEMPCSWAVAKAAKREMARSLTDTIVTVDF